MAIQGLRDTSGFVADQRPKNWREGILLLEPNGNTPLFALTSLMASREVDDPEFNWWEKSVQDRRFRIDEDLDTTETEITLLAGSTGRSLKDGDLLMVEQTLELLRVVGDPTSDTSIVVQRGWAGSTPTALTHAGANVNPYMFVVGSAYEEASLAPTGIAFDPAKVYNYTQIHRDTLEISRTAQKTRLRTGDAVKTAKAETLQIHSMGIERAFWFGERFEGTQAGKPIRTSRGIMRFLPSENILSATSAGMDMDELEAHLYQAFKFGSDQKMAFMGNRAILGVNQAVRKNSSYQIFAGEKEFGMQVQRLVTPYGEIVMKRHPLFNQLSGGLNDAASAFLGLESWMFILDMKNLKYVYLKDSDTKYEAELEANGLDGMKSGYISEVSLELHHPKTHTLIKGISVGSADN